MQYATDLCTNVPNCIHQELYVSYTKNININELKVDFVPRIWDPLLPDGSILENGFHGMKFNVTLLF